MQLTTSTGHVLPVLIAIVQALIIGLQLSEVWYASHSLTRWLSQNTERIDEPDPTLYKRQFERLYEMSFAVVGRTVAQKTHSPITRWFSYYLTVGITAIIVATMAYILGAGAIVGTSVAAYSSLGVFIDPVPILYEFVAVVVVLTMATMFHADSRAREFAV